MTTRSSSWFLRKGVSSILSNANKPGCGVVESTPRGQFLHEYLDGLALSI